MFELLNGKEKCTLIETMMGSGIILKPKFRKEFASLAEAKAFVESSGWEINIHFIKGSPLQREKLSEHERKNKWDT